LTTKDGQQCLSSSDGERRDQSASAQRRESSVEIELTNRVLLGGVEAELLQIAGAQLPEDTVRRSILSAVKGDIVLGEHRLVKSVTLGAPELRSEPGTHLDL